MKHSTTRRVRDVRWARRAWIALMYTMGIVALCMAVTWVVSERVMFGCLTRWGTFVFAESGALVIGHRSDVPHGAPVITCLSTAIETKPKRLWLPAARGSSFGTFSETYVGIPLWMPLALAAGFSAFANWRRCRLQPKSGVCSSCGYDLTGNVSGRCPECGTPIRHKQRRHASS